MSVGSSVVNVIFIGFRLDDGHQLSMQLKTYGLIFMKDFYGKSAVEVVQFFAVSCGTRPWLADYVKWKPLGAQEGLDLLDTRNERDAPPWVL
jgi:hypothetical protein